MTLLEQIRNEIRAALDRRQALQGTIDEIADGVSARADGSGLTEDETTRFNEARASITAIDTVETPPLVAREAELAAAEEARAAADALANRIGGPAAGRPAAAVRGVVEPDLYRQGGEHSFTVDLFRSQLQHNPEATERLARHNAHELEARDVNVAAAGALIPPQFLLDMFAPLARAGRPFSNAVRLLPLPTEGTTFNIPRGTTGTSVATQVNESDAGSETDFDETTLAVSLRTLAGAQDVSRQALERGQNVDAIVFADLAGAYAVALDVANITAALATGSIEVVSYTDASPTLPELHPKIADAVQRVNSNRFMPATAIFMHPRRWGWCTAQVDSTGRPLVSIVAPMNPVGVGVAAEYGQVVGSILGLPVITDANIPTNLGAGTNEDIIIVARADDALLFEENGGTPTDLRFEAGQAKKLVVELVAYGYSAFTAGRYPKAIATVGGTGLVTPTF